MTTHVRDVSDRAVTEGARRLLVGLYKRGVDVAPMTNFYIGRNLGQPMMNRAAGELAPCWYLAGDGLRSRRVWCGGTETLDVLWNGIGFINITGHMPLGYILKLDPETWDLGPRDTEPTELMVCAPGLPASWRDR